MRGSLMLGSNSGAGAAGGSVYVVLASAAPASPRERTSAMSCRGGGWLYR
jgi:hypothetical protein